MHFQSGNVCDFVSMPFVVSVSEPIERWEALSIRVCQTDFWDRWSDRRFTFHCLQMCKYGFVSIVPLIVIRSQFWILETAASFCQIEVPSHRFLIIIGALDTNITYKDKLALALRQSDERLILENSALKSLYGGQCTLSTQLIKPKLSCCTPLPTQHHCFLKTYPI